MGGATVGMGVTTGVGTSVGTGGRVEVGGTHSVGGSTTVGGGVCTAVGKGEVVTNSLDTAGPQATRTRRSIPQNSPTLDGRVK